jgi:hypothetical protein
MNDILLDDTIPVWDYAAISPNPQELYIEKFPCVHKNDHEPVSLIQPDLRHGPWIAGGAARLWYQGQAVGPHDIDVFCQSSEQAVELMGRIMSYTSSNVVILHKSDNAVTFKYKDAWTIQVITREWFTSPAEIINRFDITVCQFVTDGYRFVTGNDTIVDLKNNKLRMVTIKGDSIKRYFKYMAYGFAPVDGLYEKILNNPAAVWEFPFSAAGEYDDF